MLTLMLHLLVYGVCGCSSLFVEVNITAILYLFEDL